MLTKPTPSMINGGVSDFPGEFPASRLSGRKLWRTATADSVDLFQAMTEITQFRKEFEVTEAGLLYLSFSVDLVHRGIVAPDPYFYEYPIGFGIRLAHRTASAQAGLAAATQNYISYAYAAGNINGLSDHYGHATLIRMPYAIAAGHHRISLIGTAHSAANPIDGLAELNGGPGTDYNYLLMEFEPALWIS